MTLMWRSKTCRVANIVTKTGTAASLPAFWSCYELSELKENSTSQIFANTCTGAKSSRPKQSQKDTNHLLLLLLNSYYNNNNTPALLVCSLTRDHLFQIKVRENTLVLMTVNQGNTGPVRIKNTQQIMSDAQSSESELYLCLKELNPTLSRFVLPYFEKRAAF